MFQPCWLLALSSLTVLGMAQYLDNEASCDDDDYASSSVQISDNDSFIGIRPSLSKATVCGKP